MDFVPFELAKKLNEKVFTCELPFAMYNETGQFCLLTTSAPYHVCDSGYKYREYYAYEDFDEFDYIAPTISQVLKWLRNEKNISIEIYSTASGWAVGICNAGNVLKDDYSGGSFLAEIDGDNNSGRFDTYEQAALSGIEYVIDNLI